MINAKIGLGRVPFNVLDNFIFDGGLLINFFKPDIEKNIQFQQPSQELTITISCTDDEYLKFETYNYCKYSFKDTYAYYFIVGYSRISPKVVSLSLQMDVLNTYDYLIRPAIYDHTFVLREHTALDSPFFKNYINDTLEDENPTLEYKTSKAYQTILQYPLTVVRYNDARTWVYNDNTTQRYAVIPMFSTSPDSAEYVADATYSSIPTDGLINVHSLPTSGYLCIRPYSSYSRFLKSSNSNISYEDFLKEGRLFKGCNAGGFSISDDVIEWLTGRYMKEFFICIDLFTGKVSFPAYLWSNENKFNTSLEGKLTLPKKCEAIRLPATASYLRFFPLNRCSPVFSDGKLRSLLYSGKAWGKGVMLSTDANYIRISPDDYFPISEPWVQYIKQIPVNAFYPSGYEKISLYDNKLKVKAPNEDNPLLNAPIGDDIVPGELEYSCSVSDYESTKKMTFYRDYDNTPYQKIANLKLFSPQFKVYQLACKDTLTDITYFDILAQQGHVMKFKTYFSPSFLNSVLITFPKVYTSSHPRNTLTQGVIQLTNFTTLALSVDSAEQEFEKSYAYFQEQNALQKAALQNKDNVIAENRAYADKSNATKQLNAAMGIAGGLSNTIVGGSTLSKINPLLGVGAAIQGGVKMAQGVVNMAQTGINHKHKHKVLDLQQEANDIAKERLNTEYNSHRLNIAMNTTASIVGDTSRMSLTTDISTGAYLAIHKLQVPPMERERLNTLFHFTGYLCNRQKVPDMYTMNRFNYVRAILALHETEAPLWAEQAYAQAFEQGVTIFHKVDDIYQEYHNRPLLQKGTDK